jgi:putative salt-induced outer membrane protein
MKKIALSTILISSLMMAAEPNTNKDDVLVTHTELGYIETTGNTKTTTFSLDAKAKKGWGKHIGNFMFDGQYASDDSVETKNKFVTELTYDYEFTKRFAFNYLLGYKSDKFSGFESQFYTGPGAKYKAIISDAHNLTFDGNILYAEDVYDTVYVDGTGTVIAYPTDPNSIVGSVLLTPSYKDRYAAYRVKGVYGWQMLENLKFSQELSFRGSFETSDNYFAYSKSGLTSKLSDIFSAGLSYKVDYVNIPADGKEKTDTTLTLNLIIDY